MRQAKTPSVLRSAPAKALCVLLVIVLANLFATSSASAWSLLYSGLTDQSSYTLRLVSNGQGNVEDLRSMVQTAAGEIGSAGGTAITVAPGTIPDTVPDREPGPGEILLSIDKTSGECFSSESCGWPVLREPRMSGTKEFVTGGRVWINPLELQTGNPTRLLHVVRHELGHALGLAHVSGPVNGVYPVMDPSKCCQNYYTADDLNGFVYLKQFLAPEVETLAATSVGVQQATLNGKVGPSSLSTTYWFEYGLTSSYGGTAPVPSASAGSGVTPVSVSTTVTGLQPSAAYHYRVVAKNSAGTIYGQDQTVVPGHQDAGSWVTRVPWSADPNAPIWTFYRGTDGKLKQLQYNGSSWVPSDMGLAMGENAEPSVVRSPSTNPNAPIWTFYRGTDGKLKQNQYNGKAWVPTDMGYAMGTNADPVVVRSPSTDPNALIWTFYRGSDNKLKQLQYNGSAWVPTDMGLAMGENADPVVVRSPSTDPNAPIWIFYRGSDNKLKQLQYNGSAWVPTDMGLAMGTNADPSVVRSPSINANAPIWIFYRGSDNKLKQLQWNTSSWVPTDMGYAMGTNADPSVVRSPSTNANAPIWIFYRGSDNKLKQLQWNTSSWVPTDMGASMGENADPAVVRSPSTDLNAPIWIFYRDGESFLAQTSFLGGWTTSPFPYKMG